MSKPKIVAVVGHTASGKTGLAIALAERLGGEIVCCDNLLYLLDAVLTRSVEEC